MIQEITSPLGFEAEREDDSAGILLSNNNVSL